jgi:hypothetical protein
MSCKIRFHEPSDKTSHLRAGLTIRFLKTCMARRSKMVHRQSRQLTSMHNGCGVSDVCPTSEQLDKTIIPRISRHPTFFHGRFCHSTSKVRMICTKNIQRFGIQPDPVLLCHESRKLANTCTTPNISHEFPTRVRCV